MSGLDKEIDSIDPELETQGDDLDELKEFEEELGELEDEPEVEAEEEESGEDEKPKEKTDSIPLKKYMKLKNELKAYRQKELERSLAEDKARFFDDYIKRGYPDAEAVRLAEEKAQGIKDKEEFRDYKVDLDIERLSKDSFYSDAEAFAEEIKEQMRRFKGLSVKQAYSMIRGESRLRELQTEREQKNLNQRRKSETKKVPASSPAAVKTQYKLDEYDKRALQGLRKAFPDADWTVEKYFKHMKT